MEASKLRKTHRQLISTQRTIRNFLEGSRANAGAAPAKLSFSPIFRLTPQCRLAGAFGTFSKKYVQKYAAMIRRVALLKWRPRRLRLIRDKVMENHSTFQHQATFPIGKGRTRNVSVSVRSQAGRRTNWSSPHVIAAMKWKSPALEFDVLRSS